MRPSRRASIGLLAALGFCGLGLSVTYADPASDGGVAGSGTTAIFEPLPVPEARNEALKNTLDDLERSTEDLKTLATESVGSLYSPDAITEAEQAVTQAKNFFTSTNVVNELGLSETEAKPFQAEADQMVRLISWHEQNLKYLVALWKQGQQITNDLIPIFEYGEGAVAVWDLQTDQPIVQWNADTPWTPGSTYKVFTAYSILNAIDRGEISPDNIAGWDLDGCFYDMILVSDNNCAEDWLGTYGFDRVEADAHAIGANNTFFEPGDLKSTANDLSHFMEKLYDGTILSDPMREYLIEDLYTHMHRYGIPSVMPETDRVFNKVGFVFGYMNDTAIVYTPHGDYAITIMTNYLDWEQVRQGAVVIRQALDTPLDVAPPGPKPEVTAQGEPQQSSDNASKSGGETPAATGTPSTEAPRTEPSEPVPPQPEPSDQP